MICLKSCTINIAKCCFPPMQQQKATVSPSFSYLLFFVLGNIFSFVGFCVKITSMSVFSCLVLYLVTTWSDLLKMWVEVPRFEVQNVLKNRFIFNPISQKTSKLVVQKTPKIINNSRRIFFHSKWIKNFKVS